MQIVGYLTATKYGIIGDPGMGYNYILSAGGLYLQAQNPLIKATICIAPAVVRGLAGVDDSIELLHGKIPIRLYELAFNTLYAEPNVEQYVAIIFRDGAYHLIKPIQNGNAARVDYSQPQSVVMDIHSHGSMSAGFSIYDDIDEQGFRLSMVIGKLNTLAPEHTIRLGIYGYFVGVSFGEVFDPKILLNNKERR